MASTWLMVKMFLVLIGKGRGVSPAMQIEGDHIGSGESAVGQIGEDVNFGIPWFLRSLAGVFGSRSQDRKNGSSKRCNALPSERHRCTPPLRLMKEEVIC